ncbi:GNAT family N-acetyltransferase [Luteipulveratus sp. YIM 133132]|uniref:GNAT family N-acetyltransferase n=1 Tax=Luteipulveratus flavus TaxID=3031728 RepID=UPI0023B03B50|nr:GNAT family N-acetyltransferase [Luteipulveratus sp. YIM 133132]MDE9366601.1 GNAT family N-acetyltransferase [Luteipulveratus sp. YIM 133132]
MADDNVSIARSATGDHYVISVDGAEAGVARYVNHGKQRVFFHTEVDQAYSGQGLASRLVTYALDDTRSDGLRVVPVCPYVKSFVEKHDEYADLVDPVTPAALEAIPG